MTSRRVGGRVSIVVLNWNSGRLGVAATRSALAQTWPDVEVVVVDNASEDDSLERIVAENPEVTVIRNPENLGFGGGMNTGFATTDGEFFLPLNCDAELAPDYVERLVGVLRDNERCAGAGGKVGSERVGVGGPLRITPLMRTSSLPVDTARVCDKVNGACPLYRGDALDDVVTLGGGPYDAEYFVYGEDVDLARTLSALGWHLCYTPDATAYHVRSFGSSPRLADRRGRVRTSTLQNRHRNIVRHASAPWPLFLLAAAVQDVGFVVVRLARADWRVVPDAARAWVGVARRLFSDAGSRRRIRRAGRMRQSAR